MSTNQYNDIFSLDEESMDIFMNYPFYVIDFYSHIKQLGNLTGSVIFTIEQYISKRMFNNYTISDILDKIPYELDYSIQVVFHEVYKKLLKIYNNAINLREMYKSDLNSYYICKVAIITICAFAVLSSIVYIIQINIIDITDKTKINFLSSEEISESLSVGKLSVNLKDESIEGILGISLALAFKVICVIV